MIIQNFNLVEQNDSEKRKLAIDYDSSVEDIDDLIIELKGMQLTGNNIDILNKETDLPYLSSPLRVFFDITYECNLRCKHCFTESGLKKVSELNDERKRFLIDQLNKMGVFRMSIAGGEPFILGERLFDFISYARSKEIDISITTNGTLINNNIIDRLNTLGIKTITISLDGGTSYSHDYIRGKGQFDKVINTIVNLKERYDGKVSIKTTLMKNNIGEVKQIISLAEDMGCSSVKFNCVREDGRAKGSQDLLLDRNDYINTVKNAVNFHSEKLRIKLPLNIYDCNEYSYIKELGFGCFAGKESICIDPLGNVRPCSHMPSHFIAGNILDQTLEEIWQNSDILNVFRNLKGNTTCNNCKKYDKCRGGCRHRALLAGDINGKDPFCYLHKT